jgi:hypothetical protein
VIQIRLAVVPTTAAKADASGSHGGTAVVGVVDTLLPLQIDIDRSTASKPDTTLAYSCNPCTKSASFLCKRLEDADWGCDMTHDGIIPRSRRGGLLRFDFCRL